MQQGMTMTESGTGPTAASGADPQRITPSDISERVRQIIGGAGDAAEQVSSAAVAVAATVGTGLVLAAFLFGRRRGRRRSTLVEIVRV